MATAESSASGVLSGIAGQPAAIQTLRQALRQRRVHHAYRFEGPSGVGKHRTAVALAQTLLCTTDDSEGCGTCSACKRAATLAEEVPHVPQHPDLIYVGRGLYPPPYLNAREASGISVEQIRKIILTRVGYGPHEQRALVIIVHDADELTLSAANALLKTLEEPGARIHFILLTSRPHRLLDTIRSRTLAVRFGPLPDPVVEQLLSDRGLDPAVAGFAEGSIGRAVELANSDASAINQAWLKAMDSAQRAPTLAASLELASQLPKARTEVQARLMLYAQHLAGQVRRVAVGSRATPALGSAGSADTDRTEREREALQLARRYSCLQRALAALERNVTPTLVVEALLVELRSV